MSHQYKFPKAEHLCLKRDIERLFSAGTKSLSAYPLRVVVGAAETGSVPVKVLMSVSKRRLHHAVDRNRAKRQMREAYRLNKHILKDGGNDILFSYNCKEVLDFKTLEAEVITILSRIAKLSTSDK